MKHIYLSIYIFIYISLLIDYKLTEAYRQSGGDEDYKDKKKMALCFQSVKRVLFKAGREQIAAQVAFLVENNFEFFASSEWMNSEDKWKSLQENSAIVAGLANYYSLAQRLYGNQYHVETKQSDNATIAFLLSAFSAAHITIIKPKIKNNLPNSISQKEKEINAQVQQTQDSHDENDENDEVQKAVLDEGYIDEIKTDDEDNGKDDDEDDGKNYDDDDDNDDDNDDDENNDDQQEISKAKLQKEEDSSLGKRPYYYGTVPKPFGYRKKGRMTEEAEDEDEGEGEKEKAKRGVQMEEEPLTVRKVLFSTPTKSSKDLQQTVEEIVSCLQPIFKLNYSWSLFNNQETIDILFSWIKSENSDPAYFLKELQTKPIWGYFTKHKEKGIIREESAVYSFLQAHYVLVNVLARNDKSTIEDEDLNIDNDTLLDYAKKDAEEMMIDFPDDVEKKAYAEKLNNLEPSKSSSIQASAVSFHVKEFTFPFMWNCLKVAPLQMLDLFVECDEDFFELQRVVIMGKVRTQPFCWTDIVNPAQYNMFIDASGKVDLAEITNKLRSREFFEAFDHIAAIMVEAKDKAKMLNHLELDWMAKNYANLAAKQLGRFAISVY